MEGAGPVGVGLTEAEGKHGAEYGQGHRCVWVSRALGVGGVQHGKKSLLKSNRVATPPPPKLLETFYWQTSFFIYFFYYSLYFTHKTEHSPSGWGLVAGQSLAEKLQLHYIKHLSVKIHVSKKCLIVSKKYKLLKKKKLFNWQFCMQHGARGGTRCLHVQCMGGRGWVPAHLPALVVWSV